MAVSQFTPKTLSQLVALAATEFATQPGVQPANTDAGSSLGPIFDAVALIALFLQNELEYTNQILFLSAIPALPSGQANPDVDSFCSPFGVFRLGGNESTGQVTCSTASPVGSQVVVPVGVLLQTAPVNGATAGVTFEVYADPTNAAYNSGLNGYPINVGLSSVNVSVQCTTKGLIGNVPANSITQVFGSGMPASITRIFNATALDNAVAQESDQALKSRFTITVSSGRVGTANAEIAAYLALQPDLIYSYGDRLNPDGTTHDGFFTFVANNLGSGVGPPDSLLDAAHAAINAVRSGGISFTVVAPSLTRVSQTGVIIPILGYDFEAVNAAAIAQANAFVNAIGLNPGPWTPATVANATTRCSLARAYNAILNTQIDGVNVVYDIQNLAFTAIPSVTPVNGDLILPFGGQFVAGSGTNFTQGS